MINENFLLSVGFSPWRGCKTKFTLQKEFREIFVSTHPDITVSYSNGEGGICLMLCQPCKRTLLSLMEIFDMEIKNDA